uniref:SAM-dependent methyltransferase, MidA family n=1 Tax=Candidatus Kentrum eta TaxID=2126337 RepID=A0A450UZC0_9GAMM|nr:MAG: SAM-dependent methyltransferase, MidA family [Candidatus Kentron sp. H]VFJ97883.1 MAG: SAM-dependent methyltransferase, MidA family [Candidatus Kentron sp. H]VFK03149.1 MAG: SAM-dependent methyltransferase, MidA family [Candidatus Kentron sp. H]
MTASRLLPNPGGAGPEPGEAALKRSRALIDRIRAEMRPQGGHSEQNAALPFDGFMALALYAPGLGYYQSQDPKFGEPGDFITAPEVSPLFSRCIARQVGEIIVELNGGEIFEVGAGSGVMAADIMDELARQGTLPHRYLILEKSPALGRRQQATLAARVPELFHRFHWPDRLSEAASGETGFRGVILANELLDALPACRFSLQGGAVLEWRVGWAEGRFVWRTAPARPAVAAAVRHTEKMLGRGLPDGYTSEAHLAQAAWVREAVGLLEAGLVLLVDYGYPRAEYYHPQRQDGALACHYRHRLHDDPFLLPGLQDISVHVDFSALAEAGLGEAGLVERSHRRMPPRAALAHAANPLDNRQDPMDPTEGGNRRTPPRAALAGFTTQRDFLFSTGLLEMCAHMDPTSREYLKLVQGIKTLTLPGEMGDMVKVMGFTKGIDRSLMGFKGRDLRGRL